MYQARRPARTAFVPVRTLRYHLQRWGDAEAGPTPLVLVHGWMDVGASWQFMVDAFSEGFAAGRAIIAPDWRGYGQTAWGQVDNYWFPDYLADLDVLLDQVAGDRPVDLVGHSMGGNVAMMYAGVRPARIRRLVNLEGFGMAATRPEQAPARYARWIDELKALHRGDLALASYPDAAGVARRLMKTNPRLPQDKADWLARHWARPNAEGRWEILGDPAHKIVNAQLYRVDEALALYRAIAAPTLCVEADRSSLDQWWKGTFTQAEFHQRLQHVPRLERAVVREAGHMLHHDQPEQLALLIERFLA